MAQFTTWASDAVGNLRTLTDALSGDEEGEHPSVQEIYDLAHNLKGMGASFNFDLISSAGASLCQYIKYLPDGAVASKRAIEAHVRVFEVVMENAIVGDGGERGEALINLISSITKEEVARYS